MSNIKLNKRGFTLIEVVLVLAIGGLIFLLAFLAFQQASKNRRDTQRRSDAARIVSEAQNFKGDNNGYPDPIDANAAAGDAGITPTSAKSFINSYLGGANFKDPSTSSAYMFDKTTLALPATGHITYQKNFKCSTDGSGGLTASTGNFAVIIGLEKGTVCRDDL